MSKAARAAGVRWRKSSASANETACVELAHHLGAVRDSKAPLSPALAVDVRALVTWARAIRP